jgi:hypothetical protein
MTRSNSKESGNLSASASKGYSSRSSVLNQRQALRTGDATFTRYKVVSISATWRFCATNSRKFKCHPSCRRCTQRGAIYASIAQHSPPGVLSHFHWSAKGFIGGVQWCIAIQCTLKTCLLSRSLLTGRRISKIDSSAIVCFRMEQSPLPPSLNIRFATGP